MLVQPRIHLNSDEKNIIDWRSWEKCNHCKKQHELYLNYNSNGNFSLWVEAGKIWDIPSHEPVGWDGNWGGRTHPI